MNSPAAPPPAWLDELPLTPGPPWLAMGVRTLDLERWLVVDDRYHEELALKRRLLADRHGEVFAARPDAADASAETLELVRGWLAAHHPHLPTHAAAASRLHPLDEAGRLVQEDLCLLVERGDRYLLEAASLCFPSHWRLHEKLGRTIAAIHAPVAHYAEELETKVDTFFRRLRVDRPVVRRNLSIHDHDELFRPEPHELPDSFAPDPSGIGDVWLRSERQTLVRLPRSGAVLFTIKTQQCRATALATRPDLADRLAARLHALADEHRRTGEPPPFPRWLATWLESCRAEAPIVRDEPSQRP